jgi:hypothetical protein
MAGLFGVAAIVLIAPAPGKAETPPNFPVTQGIKLVSGASERKAAAFATFNRGAVGEAARMIRQLAEETQDRVPKAILLRDLMEVCTAAYDAACVERAAVEAFPIANAEPVLKPMLPEFNAYLVGAEVWRNNKEGLDKVFRQNAVRWFAPDISPVSSVTANLAAHTYFLRTDDRRAATMAYSAAMMSLLLINPDNGSGIATALVDVFEAMMAEQDVVSARNLFRLVNAYVSTRLGHEGPAWAKYVDLAARLMAQTNRSAVAAPLLAEASRLNARLDIDDGVKMYRLATQNSLQSLAFVLDGKIDDAAKAHAQHPLSTRKDEIIRRGRFDTAQEFYFAVSDALILYLKRDGGEQVWKPLFEASAFAQTTARWQLEPNAARDFDSYRQFTLGLIVARDSKAQSASLLQQAARLRIENFEAMVRERHEGFPLPSSVDQFIVRAALASLSEFTAPDREDLMLRGNEMLLRSLRHQVSDFAVLLGAQPSERARAAARSYHLLLEQKREGEMQQIKVLLEKQPRNVGAMVNAYVELTQSLTRLGDALAVDRSSAKTGKDIAYPDDTGGYPDVKQIQSALNDDEVFVTYVPTFGGIGRLCIAKAHTVSSFATVNAAKLDLDIKVLRLALTADDAPNEMQDSQFPVAAAIRVHRFLFDGLGACLKAGVHVQIAVPEPVAGIPIAALLAEAPPARGEGFDLTRAQWLGRSFSFSSVVSARHWLSTRQGLAHRAPSKPYLGIGDPELAQPQRVAAAGSNVTERSGSQGNGLSDLPPLPETAEELAAAQRVFGAGDILTGRRASEEAFRSQDLGAYDVIHFATHGLLKGEVDGLTESALVLTPADPADSFNDGLLTAAEIAPLSLNARLVVLSACNTARIDTATASRGAADLQAAFSVAGAPTMLASLWPVETSTARDLVTGFFRVWHQQGQPGVSLALAEATRDYLAHADRAHQHPRFWATFVVLGDGGHAPSDTALLHAGMVPTLAALPDNAAGEIIDVQAYGNGLIASMQGDWNGQSMAGIIKDATTRDGQNILTSREIGAGRLLVYGASFYAMGYRISERSFPILRKIGDGGRLIWEKRFDELIDVRLSDGAIVDGAMVVVLDTGISQPDRQIILVKLDSDGRELARSSLKAPPITGLTMKPSLLFKAREGLVLVVNAEAAVRVERSPTDNLGLPSLCWGARAAELFKLDATSLATMPLTSIVDFHVAALGESNGKLMLGGEKRQHCARNGTAQLVEISEQGASRQIWADDDPFPSGVGALSASDDDIALVVNRQRPIGIRSMTPKAIDLSSKRWGDDGREQWEFSSLALNKDGKVLQRYDSSFGLSSYVQGMVRDRDATFVFGSLGGRPAISMQPQ